MPKIIKNCVFCDKEKLIQTSQLNKTKSGNVFCSNKCVGLWSRGKKRVFTPEWCKNLSLSKIGKRPSLETRKNMSLAQLGRKHTEVTKEKLRLMRLGNKNPFFGKKHSEKTLRKLKGRISHNKGKPMFPEHKAKISGTNSPHWKGGVSKDKEYRRNYSKEYRHRLGISKKYQTGISYTKEYQKLFNNKRRNRFITAGILDIKTIQLVYEDNIKQYGTLTCYLCLKPILFGKDHLEHKTPLSRNGTNLKGNLDIACEKCNLTKRNKTVEEFLEWRKNKQTLGLVPKSS